MIQFIEFRIPVKLSDEQAMKISHAKKGVDVTAQLLPEYHKGGRQFVKVTVDVPSFLGCGDYEENTVIHDIPSFLKRIRDHLIWLGLRDDQLQSELHYRVDKLTVGFNAFLGNRNFYREDIPPTECIRYSALSKWVYHIGPKTDFLTAFHGQGRKLMLADEADATGDYMKHISIHEGIFSYRFDLTSNQMDQMSSNRRLDDMLNANKLYEVLHLWSKKLHHLPIFNSLDQIMKVIDEADASIKVKHRLKRFLIILIDGGSKECEQCYSKASFIRNYSDLKKLLGVPAILLREHNDKEELFLQPYEEWYTVSRQGRGEAELVQALTSGF